MKQNLVYFLLGIFIMIFIAATPIVSNLFTIKPATPTSVFSKSYHGDGVTSDMVSDIRIYSSKGYIVKKADTMIISSSGTCTCVLIMEKY